MPTLLLKGFRLGPFVTGLASTGKAIFLGLKMKRVWRTGVEKGNKQDAKVIHILGSTYPLHRGDFKG